MNSSSAKSLPSLRMPAEWSPHEATWLVWPSACHLGVWSKNQIRELQTSFLKIIATLLPHEKVRLVIENSEEEKRVLKNLEKQTSTTILKRLEWYEAVTQDLWIRDYGPTFVLDSEGKKRAWLWQFNAWGKKYPKLILDGELFKTHAEAWLHCSYEQSDWVMEGGAVEVDGIGIGITTESCLLNPNRNPQKTKDQIDAALKRSLGLTELIWLEGGLEGDDTDGHIDEIVRFVDPQTLVMVEEGATQSSETTVLRENEMRLKNAQIKNQKKWNRIEIPRPEIRYRGKILPASYANFYIANQIVLMPSFGHELDSRAQEILQDCFPNRKVVPISSETLMLGCGALHCVTQQEPKANQ